MQNRDRSPKVLFVLYSFPILSETFILDQIIGLQDRGANVSILAATEPAARTMHPEIVDRKLLEATEYLSNLQSSSVRKYGARIRAYLAALFRMDLGFLFDKHLRDAWEMQAARAHSRRECVRYDAIIAHFGPFGELAARLRHVGMIDGPLFTFFHGYDLSTTVSKNSRGRCYEMLFQKGEHFLAISEYWKEVLVRLGAPAQRVDLHRMAIDCDRFIEMPIRQFDVTAELKILCIGRMVEKKGFRYAILAMHQLATRRPEIGFQLNLVGDGPLRSELETQARNGPAANRIHFLGALPRDQVIRRLEQSHLFLTPSATAQDGDMEGIPVVLMEAMAAGVPVIASRHSGIPELVIDNKTGRLFPEKDHLTLLDQVLAAIDAPLATAQMAESARAHVRTNFELGKWNDRLFELVSGTR